ncbi:metallophosphoesterase [Nakamurella flavida]|uniref:Metallophosphoesterase n=1 Tax=Nakamurella flavida TaxID=363630 RepID=A0A939C366_9ACTN|nr:metallophosphoesterase [Nakamurella flavida]MBM9477315.1 metallophosphoesterase [Nakamurella flavida]MDP9779771.1 hypothetical protein [Nakamurella flavida]
MSAVPSRPLGPGRARSALLRRARWWTLPLAAVLTVSLAPVAQAAGTVGSQTAASRLAAAAVDCAALDVPVLRRVDPDSRVNLITTSAQEATAAAADGFTQDEGSPFRVAPLDTPGLTAAHRLTNPRTGNLVWMAGATEITNAVARYGYVDLGGDFAVSTTAQPCLEPVYRLRLAGVHSQVVGTGARDSLVAQGWTYEKIAFWVAPAGAAPAPGPTPAPSPGGGDTDTSFTIAVIPDTQQEVLSGLDGRFAQRNSWLVDQRSALDLRYVLHTGDLVNWDTPDHSQYAIGSDAMQVLDDADIPWAAAIGNHDTGAVCAGGSACPGKRVRTAVRDTSTYNHYFPTSRHDDLQGTFEAGKIDNSWSSFQAGGSDFIVMTLELWPRAEVVRWAEQVIATHPDDNVIIVTHSYLDGSGGIYGGADYGVTSPQGLFDSLVNRYDNVKLVFSGHVGTADARQDVRADGTTSAAFLGAFHSNVTNPVQLITIDTAADTVSRRFTAPWTGDLFPGLELTYTNMGWE